MKIKLIFPPVWAITQPYLSLPSLAAFLNTKGIAVEQTDMNLDLFDTIFSPEIMSACKDRLKLKSQENTAAQAILGIADYLIDNVITYKNRFRSAEALDFGVYNSCVVFLEKCLALCSCAYFPESINFREYVGKYDYRDSEQLLECLKNAKNGKDESFMYSLLSDLAEKVVKNADLIGISLTSIDQIVPTFMLIGLINKLSPTTKIVIGGSHVSRWIKAFPKLAGFFDYIDYFILYEGERPLYDLIRHISGEIGIEEVNNLVYMDEQKQVVINQLDRAMPTTDELPTPLFNKSDIKRYFSPSPVLPLLASRGCHWGKCSFCDHSLIYQHNYSKRTTQLIVEDMKEYQAEYGVNYINFHDEAISHSQMEALTQALAENNMQIKWTCCARFDNNLDYNTLKNAHNSGLTVLFFGLESINKRVLALMRKGTNPDIIKRVLTDSNAAGIWNHVFYIGGFPGETLEEFLETYAFVKGNQDIIHSSGCSHFDLSTFSLVAQNPEKYGIKLVENSHDLAYLQEYIMSEMADGKEREKLYKSAITEALGSRKEYITIVFRDHWAMFAQYGNPNVSILKPWIFIDDSRQKLTLVDLKLCRTVEFGEEAKPLMEIMLKTGNPAEAIKEMVKHFKLSDELASSFYHIFEDLLRQELVLN